jgi:hypothetical protein
MSQENPTPEERQQKNKETRNRLMLSALLLLLLVVIYSQFFSSGDASKSSSPAPSANLKATPSPTPQRQTSGTPAPIISEPLAIASIQQGGSHSSGGTGRNIFIYPTPTPIPPPPPSTPAPTPTPWPVPVSSLNPGGVIARTAGFTLTIFGQKIPQDVQGFVNGSAYPTTFVSDTQVRINVPAEAIRMPGSLNVMVRSQSDPNLISNTIPLNVAAPPEPPYKYIGHITLKNVPTAVLVSQSSEDDVYNVRKGGVIGGKWKIVNITPQKVEIEDTSIKVSHVINYTVDNK